MNDLSGIIERKLLPFVNQPAQYVGGEVNAVRKDWDAARLRVCLAFPDTYTIGISHYGSGIIYEMVNNMAGCLCERTYLPWVDAQVRMRGEGIPLFSWESCRPVRDFDVLAVSLQYELLYTNMLSLLDLAGVPIRAAERGAGDPLVLAGGPASNNPEPMAPFVDLYFIGEAEAGLVEVLEMAAELKLREPDLPRAERIGRLASQFSFLYAPAFYEPRYDEAGRFSGIERLRADMPEVIEAAQVADLDAAPAVLHPLVPSSEAVHDRLAIEIMRGCPRRCRFCEASHTKGRVRLRSARRVLELARSGIGSTGFEELTLLSLSSSDHPELHEMLRLLDEEFRDQNVSVALPSLRTNEQLAEMPALVANVRKSGLTLVPEASSERLRRAISKDVDEQHLVAGAGAAFARGWNLLKLYFMVGLPDERPEEIDGIITLADRLAQERQKYAKGPAKVNISVATLIPRPHTPMQWLGMLREEEVQQKRQRLRDLVREKRYLTLKFHHIERSVLEGVLARGDRRLSAAIERSWQLGSVFDAWDETFDYSRWKQAFADCGIDADWYAHRGRDADERLPWDHINVGSKRSSLRRQYEAMMRELSGDGEGGDMV